MLLKDQGQLEEAEPLLREALDGRRETLGDRHPATQNSISNLAGLLHAQGKLEEAASMRKKRTPMSTPTVHDHSA
jgi:hypothetical protein